VLPLYSTLTRGQQGAVFESSERRKCIVSTNIAETSLTIDGIVYVIDFGLVKQLVWNTRVRMEMLLTVPASKAAANQRKGRAGRTQPGVCYRLYTQEHHDLIMRQSTRPAIITDDSISAVLEILVSGFSNILAFDWIDPPARESVYCALERLNDMYFLL
jgi:pre-mRNA-splicing factor ATP-dependent RNA helicase DHX15/PRP43